MLLAPSSSWGKGDVALIWKRKTIVSHFSPRPDQTTISYRSTQPAFLPDQTTSIDPPNLFHSCPIRPRPSSDLHVSAIGAHMDFFFIMALQAQTNWILSDSCACNIRDYRGIIVRLDIAGLSPGINGEHHEGQQPPRQSVDHRVTSTAATSAKPRSISRLFGLSRSLKAL